MSFQPRVIFGLVMAGVVMLLSGCNSAPVLPEGHGAQKGGTQEVQWRHMALEEAPPTIREWVEQNCRQKGNYSRFTAEGGYFLIAGGERPTGGHRVVVERIMRGQEGLHVLANLHSPPPGSVVTQAITYPFTLAFVPGIDRQLVEFTVVEAGAAVSGSTGATGGEGSPDETQPDEPVATSLNFQVWAPAPGTTVVVGKPLVVRGKARVFEATFTVELEDGHRVLARQVVTADQGAPGWGSFQVDLPFQEPTSSHGTLLFVTESAADGSRQEELIIPVTFDRFQP